jgi:broad specificity phosphatase PhoE
MTRRLRWPSAALFAIALSFAPSALLAADSDSALTTIYIVRHAEKNQHAPGGDAGLSAKGILRAQDLVRTLKDAGLDAVYATQFPRARLSAEPIARALGDSVQTYDANYPDSLVDRIRTLHRGEQVLVVGHSDTIPQTLEGLLDARFDGEAVEYDRLYVVLLGPGETRRLLRLRYGAAP